MTMPVSAGAGNDRQARVTVTANVDPFAKSMGAATKAANAFGEALKKVDQTVVAVMKKAGMVAMGGGALALFGDVKAVQAAAAYEQQLKTLGAQTGKTGSDVAALGKEVNSLGKTVPMTTGQLNALVTTIASVGVRGSVQLKMLTEQAAKLAAATNTPPGQLLTGLVETGRMLGTSLQDVKRYGDVLTQLQQGMGASATDTMQFAQGIAAVAQKAGVGEASLLGFAGAFQKLGIDSTSGAQVFNVIMNDMTDAVSRGTNRMQLYANTVGMTSQSFKSMFANNPSQAFVKFVDSIAAQGQRGGQILDQFGLDGTRLIRVFAAMTSGSANLQGALNEANSAFASGNATQRAAEQVYDSFNSKVGILENGFESLREEIGQGFLPVLGRVVDMGGTVVHTLAKVAGYLNAIHLPFVGDFASKWGGIAAGVGLVGGAFGILFGSIVKVTGAWRLLSGVIGGKFFRGVIDGGMRGRLQGIMPSGSAGWGNEGREYYRDPRDLGPNASRTQMLVYRGGYNLARGMRTTGPLVNPEAGMMGVNGRARGLVGATVAFPLTRAKQMYRQTRDTILHPLDASNRDIRATDPFSMYGGYQQLTQMGGQARGAIVSHFRREGASQFERNMADRIENGLGDPNESASKLKHNRWEAETAAFNATHARQRQINSQLSVPQARELLHQTQLTQFAAGEVDQLHDFSKMKGRELNKALDRQAVWAGRSAQVDAHNQFNAAQGDPEIEKLAGPFKKLAEKVKEITKSVATSSADVMKELMTALKNYFTAAVNAVANAAKQMAAAVIKAKAMAGGATATEAEAAGHAAFSAMGGVNPTAAPGTPGGPAAPMQVNRRIGGLPPVPPAGAVRSMSGLPENSIPASGPGSLPNAIVPSRYGPVNPEALANKHTSGAEHIRAGTVGQEHKEQPGMGSRVISNLDEKLGGKLSPTIDKLHASMLGARDAALTFAKDTGNLARQTLSRFMMPLMMYGGLAAMALSALTTAINKTAKDTQFAGNEMSAALGREWKSPTQLAQERMQASNNKADQDPWGRTEHKDAHSADFTKSYASTLAELRQYKNADGAKGVQAVLQQQLNAMVTENNGAPADDAVKKQIRELLMNSGLSKQQQQTLYSQLDYTGGANPGFYSMGLKAAQGKGQGYVGDGSDLVKTLTAQATSDLKLQGNANAAAYLMLQANPELGGTLNTTSFTGNGMTQNVANGLVAQMNNGVDKDEQRISLDNKSFGMIGVGRDLNTANTLNGFLTQLEDGSEAGKQFAETLRSAYAAAGMTIDADGHVQGSAEQVAEALKKLETAAGGATFVTAATHRQLAASRPNAIYQQLTGDSETNLGALASNPEALNYGSRWHRVVQELVNDGAYDEMKKTNDALTRSPLFTASADVGITSPNYIAGLKNAIVQIQALKDSVGTPSDKRWQEYDKWQQDTRAKLTQISDVTASPYQQLHDQADIFSHILDNGVDENNVDQIQNYSDQLQTLYANQASTLKSAYMNVRETQRQMSRSTQDFQHQQLLSQRDYDRQVAENNYQFQKSQDEANYQYAYSLKQRQYSFDESIRSSKYAMANAFGSAGSMVQAQYTQGASGTLYGMQAQVDRLRESKQALDGLSGAGLSDDSIRVLKLDDPTNVEQAKRYLKNLLEDPSLVKQFNDSVSERLNLTEAISADPHNSAYAEMKRTFDKTASDAAAEFQHSQQLANDSFSHSVEQAAISYQTSMTDFQYNFDLQMSRTKDDMSRMNEYISMSTQELTDWATNSGIPGLAAIAAGMSEVAAQMQRAQDLINSFGAKKKGDPAKGTGGAYNVNSQNSPAWQRANGVDADGNALPYKPSSFDPGNPHHDPNVGDYGLPKPGDPSAMGPGPYANAGHGGKSGPISFSSGYGLAGVAGAMGTTTDLSQLTGKTGQYADAVKQARREIDDYKDVSKKSTATTKDRADAEGQAKYAILLAVDAAGKKADADNQGKTPAEQAKARIDAQKTAFNELTSELGFVPGGLSTLNTALNNSKDPLTNTKTVADNLTTSISSIPKDTKIKVNAETADAEGKIGGLKGVFHDAIKFAINDVLNDVLVAGWNWVADKLGLDSLHVDPFKLPKGFATGGYTGDGLRYDAAGVVHKGEFVLDQEKTRKHRPLLEAIHRGDDAAVPGYAKGGYASGVTWTQLDAIRKTLFPDSVLTSSTRNSNDYHGRGEAIDIGVAGNKQSGLMPIAAKLATMYPNSTELIHNPNGSIKNGAAVPASFWGAKTWGEHANHVHWAMTPEALAKGSTQDKAPGSSDWSVLQAIMDPIGYLRHIVGGVTGGKSGLTGKAGAVPGKLIDGMAGHLGEWLGNAFGFGDKTVVGAGSYAGDSVQAIVQKVAAQRGWGSGGEWDALYQLVQHESGFKPRAQNPGSSAYGLFQFLDSTWKGTGYAKTPDPAIQTQAGLAYIGARYGTPSKAWSFWNSHNPHWYGQGGVFDSAQTIGVGEAGPEAVLPLNSTGAQFVAQTLKASLSMMDPSLAQTIRRGRTASYASPARSEMHVHHTDASTNYNGDIHVHAQDPNEMGRKLAEQKRVRNLTRMGSLTR